MNRIYKSLKFTTFRLNIKTQEFFRKTQSRHCSLFLHETSKEDLEKKIIYNCNFKKLTFVQIKKLEKKSKKNSSFSNENLEPIFLKYIHETEPEKECDKSETEDTSPIHMPYSTLIKTEYISDKFEESTSFSSDTDKKLKEKSVFPESSELGSLICDPYPSEKQWMNDYEKYSEEPSEDDLELNKWQSQYGSPDSAVPVSEVPCGGCGALLHCQDSSIPGYLPQEIFKNCNEKDLRALKCQRCHFLENYNIALSVAVDPNLYPLLLSKIKDVRALAILLVDLTDFPCSIWPGILDIIGKKRPIFLVGNKVDLLWGDSRGWLEHVKGVLKGNLPPWANVQHVSLISAKTGFGIEELITKLHNFWQYKGDVYLIGCTNVGKSTLFNALLQSDYCKVKAVDLVQRATTAPWPGTTLNLLKFPILRPEGWRLFLRTKRLISESKHAMHENKLRKEQKKANKFTPPQLIGHIGRTFWERPPDDEIVAKDTFSIPNRKQIRSLQPPGSGLDPNEPELAKSRWLFDSPGVLHSDQILDLLTTEEVVITLPKKVIEPKTFLIRPGWTTFIAGLARLDYLKGESPVKFTIFCSSNLPITICETLQADELYTSLLGSEYMAVPQGKNLRLDKWPGLQQGSELTLCGIHKEESCADIVLSSAGWIAVTPETKEICKFLPWTPYQRGIHVRHPALLPFAVSLRGKKIAKSPIYSKSRTYS